jgi:hypothetical protein
MLIRCRAATVTTAVKWPWRVVSRHPFERVRGVPGPLPAGRRERIEVICGMWEVTEMGVISHHRCTRHIRLERLKNRRGPELWSRRRGRQGKLPIPESLTMAVGRFIPDPRQRGGEVDVSACLFLNCLQSGPREKLLDFMVDGVRDGLQAGLNLSAGQVVFETR